MLTDKETVKFLEDFGDVKTLRELQKVCIILNIGKKDVKQILLFWNKQIRLFFICLKCDIIQMTWYFCLISFTTWTLQKLCINWKY